MVNWIDTALETAKDITGLVAEVRESMRPVPQGLRGPAGVQGPTGVQGWFDPRTMMDSTMMGSSFSFPGSLPGDMHDHVFRGAESVPTEIFHKRVEEFRKKHPDTMEPLEKMHKIVYGTTEWQEGKVKVKKTVKKTEDGGMFAVESRMLAETIDRAVLEAMDLPSSALENMGKGVETATQARGAGESSVWKKWVRLR